METGNRLAVAGDGAWKWWKEGEGSSKKTCMNDPQTRTMVSRLTVGVGAGWVEEGKGGKIRTTIMK